METIFIQALVQAGSCQKHAKHTAASTTLPPFVSTHHRSRRKRPPAHVEDVRGFRSQPGKRRAAGAATAAVAEVTREEFKGLVDFYSPVYETLEDFEVPKMPDEDPKLDEPMSNAKDVPHQPWPAHSEAEQASVFELDELLDQEQPSHETIYHIYQTLPFPRVSYLSLESIRRLFNHLSVVERKDQSSMERYLSIVDDMKEAGIPMTVAEWNTAVAFAGRWYERVTAAEVENALHIWKEMEHQAGVQGTNVTFNILFDIATKAGKYVLAEMIMKEMQKRNLKYNRYFRFGLIYYYGLRADGDGVRRAYKDFVEAGEIVDTAVMNCVMVSLIRAGEPTAAEEVFLRMKRLNAQRAQAALPPGDWRSARDLGILLDKAARRFRTDAAARQRVQDASPVAPDLHTFRILVAHHALTSANIDRVTDLLAEMCACHIEPSTAVYTHLFRGFALHGGVRYSSWTIHRLESIWTAYRRAIDDGVAGCAIDPATAHRIVRAFAKCAGRERTLAVWEEVRRRWMADEEELEAVNRALHVLFVED
ncbi:hypothetical protein LTR04_002942 [Oleoguttula sp. CCFEE 6159]|nr:hypothetical protein LTR04_002942 [Oleoguttula sp. CCFEE 6159]